MSLQTMQTMPTEARIHPGNKRRCLVSLVKMLAKIVPYQKGEQRSTVSNYRRRPRSSDAIAGLAWQRC
jgi:hypothetical protein